MAQVVYPFDTLEKRKRKKGKKTARWDNNSRIANEGRFARSLVLLIDGIGGKTLGRTFYEHASGHLMRDAIYVERVCAIGEVIRMMVNRDLIG